MCLLSITAARRSRSCRDAIRCSSIACSFFASSYSEFSAMSPNSRACLIRSATSRRLTVERCSISALSFSWPSGVRITSFKGSSSSPRTCNAVPRGTVEADIIPMLSSGKRSAPGYHSLRMAVDLEARWNIGPVQVPGRLVLAPMAGVSVQAFRRQGRRYGAGLVCSEMVSCAGLSHGNERTLGYLRIGRDEHPLAVQIFGSEPKVMAEAARMVEDAGADLVDINFGCPVRKVTKTGAGATLLDEPDRAYRIVESVASTLSLHPRSARQMYTGEADHALTAELVDAVDVPVVASGDVTSRARAHSVLAT